MTDYKAQAEESFHPPTILANLAMHHADGDVEYAEQFLREAVDEELEQV